MISLILVCMTSECRLLISLVVILSLQAALAILNCCVVTSRLEVEEISGVEALIVVVVVVIILEDDEGTVCNLTLSEPFLLQTFSYL